MTRCRAANYGGARTIDGGKTRGAEAVVTGAPMLREAVVATRGVVVKAGVTGALLRLEAMGVPREVRLGAEENGDLLLEAGVVTRGEQLEAVATEAVLLADREATRGEQLEAVVT